MRRPGAAGMLWLSNLVTPSSRLPVDTVFRSTFSAPKGTRERCERVVTAGPTEIAPAGQSQVEAALFDFLGKALKK